MKRWEADDAIQQMANEWRGDKDPRRINFVLGAWDYANGFYALGVVDDAYRAGFAAANARGLKIY